MTPALEPAEFYFLHDGRGEFEYIYNENQVEADPPTTTCIAREIARRRMQVDPDWTPYGFGSTYFDLPNVEIDPELVLAATAFESPRPRGLPHHDVIVNPTEGHTSAYYDIVSADWKAAIESVEPGVHQFFPHELRFADGLVADRFIFRCRTLVDTASPNYRIEDIYDIWNEVVGYRFVVDDTFRLPMLDRERVEGRHFLTCPSRRACYVSRALAEKLWPLLPLRTALLPVKLSGEPPDGVSFAMEDAASKGAMETAREASDGRAPPPGPLDPELADAIAVINGPFLEKFLDAKARATLGSRLDGATVERIFVIMAEALKCDAPLEKNFAVNLSVLACHARDERELLAPCRAWAADPSPLRRVTAARVLSRRIPKGERPRLETFAILTGLLDDADPNVVAQMIGILFWMAHPAYSQALRNRRDQFAHHDNPRVREFCRGLIDRESEPAVQKVKDFSGETVDSLFASTFAAMRSGDDFAPRLEALRRRDAGDLAAVAARWAQDANPDKRNLAALALERFSRDGPPAPRSVIAVLRKLSGDGDAAVAKAAVKSLVAARGQGPVSDDDLEAAEAASAHSSAATRAAYADSLAFGQSPEALDALLALAGDPADEVRRNVALHLSSYIEGSVGARRKRLRETLAGLMSDSDKYVRYFAISAFVSFDDRRVVDAIARELDGPEEGLAALTVFLLPSILARPDKRYLPGLGRMNKAVPGHPRIEDALGACRVKRWFPWG